MAGIYTFNLIVGVGALALPAAFAEAGWVLSIAIVGFLGFVALIGATYVVEILACCNALRKFERSQQDHSLKEPLLSEDESLAKAQPEQAFEISERIEVSLSAEMLLGSVGRNLFYIALIAYLMGDLAIYATSVPVTLTKVSGAIAVISEEWSFSFDHEHVYYFWLTVFAAVVVPLSLANFQKTKYLQLSTMVLRNVAFWTMIVLGIIYLYEGKGVAFSDLTVVNLRAFPVLFGTATYAFMCHHSLPGILAPIRDKSKINLLFGVDFFAIFVSYIMLAGSAALAFGNDPNESCDSHPSHPCHIQPLYTLNFASYDIRPIATFLALFPVFSLTSNFPLIAITLRNNVMELFKGVGSDFAGRQTMFSLLVVAPPLMVGYITKDIGAIVSFTGSFAGVAIMYLFPTLMVDRARRKVAATFGYLAPKNIHASPFGSPFWLYLMYTFSFGVLVFNGVTQVYKAVMGKNLWDH